MNTPRIQFWFEFASTYSYPTAMTIESKARERGIEVSWHAFLLGPIFNAQGWNDSPFNIYPAKGRYMWRDLERLCAKSKIPLVRPSTFPRSGLLAARIVGMNDSQAWIPQFVRSVYQANFQHDLNIAEPQTIADCLVQLGLDADALIAQAGSDEAKTALRNQTAAAQAKGLFGAPSFLVGDELFWGNERMDDAFDWAELIAAI